MANSNSMPLWIWDKCNGNALRFCIHSFFTICLFKRQEDFQVVLGVQVLKAFSLALKLSPNFYSLNLFLSNIKLIINNLLSSVF